VRVDAELPTPMTPAHAPAGRHLLLDLVGCDPARLDDEAALRALAAKAACVAGATVLSVHSHRFSPQGVTVVVLLAESHASLHTFPESGLAFWDCFTCGAADPERTTAVIAAGLAASEFSPRTLSRG
jgi:S-adenosylmethionine decarboxylase